MQGGMPVFRVRRHEPLQGPPARRPKRTNTIAHRARHGPMGTKMDDMDVMDGMDKEDQGDGVDRKQLSIESISSIPSINFPAFPRTF